jgi:hypothetical protein
MDLAPRTAVMMRMTGTTGFSADFVIVDITRVGYHAMNLTLSVVYGDQWAPYTHANL